MTSHQVNKPSLIGENKMRLSKPMFLFSILLNSFVLGEISCPYGCESNNSNAGRHILKCLRDLNFVSDFHKDYVSGEVWEGDEMIYGLPEGLSWKCIFHDHSLFGHTDQYKFYKNWWSNNPYSSLDHHGGHESLYADASSYISTREIVEEIGYDIEYIHCKSVAKAKRDIEKYERTLAIFPCWPYCDYTDEEEIKKEIKEGRNNIKRFMSEYNERMLIYSSLSFLIQRNYLEIFNECLAKHRWNGAYFSRGLLLFQQGDFFSSMGDISQYIKGADKQTLAEDILKAKYHLGTLQNLLGQYTEAIGVLSQVISDDPANKEAYVERSIAFFEQGNFDQALKDYIKSEIRPTKIDDSFHSLEFSGGILLGLCSGAGHTLENFVPSMLCSLQGLANGIWAFTANPKEVSVEMIAACKNLYGFFSDQTILESLKAVIPEVREICEWQNVPDFKKGEIIGSIAGKYGLDIFLTAGAAKGIKAFHELRRANAIMTLESMTTLQKAKALEEISGKWNTTVVKELDNIKSGALRNDKELYKKYRDQVLNETQVRKILHEAGFQTFDKPKNIPKNWTVEISQRQGGMRYSDPTNRHIYIRVMPGNPESPFPAQLKPYIKHTTPKGCLDKYGRIVSEKDPSAHIPLEDYNFDVVFEKNL